MNDALRQSSSPSPCSLLGEFPLNIQDRWRHCFPSPGNGSLVNPGAESIQVLRALRVLETRWSFFSCQMPGFCSNQATSDPKISCHAGFAAGLWAVGWKDVRCLGPHVSRDRTPRGAAGIWPRDGDQGHHRRLGGAAGAPTGGVDPFRAEWELPTHRDFRGKPISRMSDTAYSGFWQFSPKPIPSKMRHPLPIHQQCMNFG